MVVYLSINDEEAGPFTLYQVEEKLRSGEVDEETLAWYEGQDDWRPLEALPPFEGFFRRRDQEIAENERRARREAMRHIEEVERPSGPTHPWRRFFARNLDMYIVLCVSLLILQGLRGTGVTTLGFADFFEAVFIFLFPPWHVLEAFLIAKWGTTPGKWLLGLRVVDQDGNLLALNESFRRSLSVFVIGWGLMLPVVSLLAVGYSYWTLQRRGTTYWDANTNAAVIPAPMSLRYILAPMIAVLLLSSLVNGPMNEISSRQREELHKLWETVKRDEDERSLPGPNPDA